MEGLKLSPPHSFLCLLPGPYIVLLSALLEQRGIDNCNRIAKSSRKPAVALYPSFLQLSCLSFFYEKFT